jgi:hypothetical protein
MGRYIRNNVTDPPDGAQCGRLLLPMINYLTFRIDYNL